MVRDVGIGEIVPVQNLIVEFGENEKGYIGGYISLDGVITRVIFTPRELALATNRASKEVAELRADAGWWDRLKAYFSLGE